MGTGIDHNWYYREVISSMQHQNTLLAVPHAFSWLHNCLFDNEEDVAFWNMKRHIDSYLCYARELGLLNRLLVEDYDASLVGPQVATSVIPNLGPVKLTVGADGKWTAVAEFGEYSTVVVDPGTYTATVVSPSWTGKK